ncbi:sigma-70 family RNA polymerase sigma factor [Nonomuraea sp. MCN248]|uniref:Sigma-70 family RNA polymerase sigma factor n=1 Tax=Nonomuraea corallina TaxID=2989783 RepID=A0ABT4S606_9ACTN|nr:sigma-70 family RNA polymerase sigma factor [Nonomuraea corallina]MDA0632641.1 sigma-70 family RNA polymerase sigma factor [Nonomuraea corallina]
MPREERAGMPETDGSDPLERHRVALTGYCYRMLGSPFEAEDAVQETLVRAWRSLDRFDEDRAPMRSWLYAIATNVCLDLLRGARRRARAIDLGPSAQAGPDLGPPLPPDAFVRPVPDGRVLPAGGDPADLAAQRDTIRLAFIAALQHLPPRQRAVLILRDVLCCPADEVARLLDVSVASVTSALQRARTKLKAASLSAEDPYQPMDEAQRLLLARYCDAFERYDVEAMMALLHEDAVMSMPPFPWWLRGRAEIRRALLSAGRPCAGARLVPCAANGSPAFAQYRPGPDGRQAPFALVVLTLSGGLIAEVTNHLDADRLFPLFGLPGVLESPARVR